MLSHLDYFQFMFVVLSRSLSCFHHLAYSRYHELASCAMVSFLAQLQRI